MVNLAQWIRSRTTVIRVLLIIFYSIGFIGFINPSTRTLLTYLTPATLLLGCALLLIYQHTFSQKFILSTLMISLAGFFIEVVGVNTGFIFGIYGYSYALGPAIWHTPLLIGINWFFISYITTSIAHRISSSDIWVPLLSASLMLIYDLVLEQVAAPMQMWFWSDDFIPLKNYGAWFVFGAIFSTLFHKLNPGLINKLDLTLYFIQIIFLFAIYLTL